MSNKEILNKLVRIAENQQKILIRLATKTAKGAVEPEKENPAFETFLKGAWPIAVANAGFSVSTPEVSFNPGESRQTPDGKSIVLGSGYTLTTTDFSKDNAAKQQAITNLKNNIKVRPEFAHLIDSVNIIFSGPTPVGV